jgi:hypothetical protein
MESYDLNEGDKATLDRVLRRLEEFFLKPELETRAAFEEFTSDRKRFQGALSLCGEFIDKLRSLKLRHMADNSERADLRAALKEVEKYCKGLEEDLRGSDDPDIEAAKEAEDAQT